MGWSSQCLSSGRRNRYNKPAAVLQAPRAYHRIEVIELPSWLGKTGGEGIRTHNTLSSIQVFTIGALDRSAASLLVPPEMNMRHGLRFDLPIQLSTVQR